MERLKVLSCTVEDIYGFSLTVYSGKNLRLNYNCGTKGTCGKVNLSEYSYSATCEQEGIAGGKGKGGGAERTLETLIHYLHGLFFCLERESLKD